MGNLLLCNQQIAAMPYYIEGISVNLYSMEELCYYIANNTYLLEREFMCEDLCTWIEKELKMVELSDRLRDCLTVNGALSDFVSEILRSCAYCTKEQIENICSLIREMEEKSDFECNKIRADRLMEREKYLSSIYEYKRLLDSEDAKTENPIIVGNIWHNLGTAYARLFLFQEAISCYQKAYEKNGKEESLREELFAYRCLHDEAGFIKLARENQLDDKAMQEIRSELTATSRSEEVLEFESSLEEIAKLLENGNRTEFQSKISAMIYKWKEDYRKISRV